MNKATPVTVSFDQSQASFLTENFEFDAVRGQPSSMSQCQSLFWNQSQPAKVTRQYQEILTSLA